MARKQIVPDELDARTLRLVLLLGALIFGVTVFAVGLTALLG